MWLCVCVYDYQTNYEKRFKMKIKGKSKEIRSRWEWLDTRLFYTIVSCVLIYKSTIDSGYLSSNPHSIYASKHTHDIAAAGIYYFIIVFTYKTHWPVSHTINRYRTNETWFLMSLNIIIIIIINNDSSFIWIIHIRKKKFIIVSLTFNNRKDSHFFFIFGSTIHLHLTLYSQMK